MKIVTLILFCCLSVGLSAQDTASLNTDTLLAHVAENQINCHSLSARTVLTWDDGTTSQQFNGNFRIQKDSLIWLSLSMFGFEGARAVITPDTFRLLNKMSSEYLVKHQSFIQNWLLLPLNFHMLQQLIMGEKISINEKASLVAYEDSSYVIYLESDKLLEKVWLNLQNYTLRKILLKDKLLKQEMTITFDSYNSLRDKPFSYKRSIDIARNGDTMHLNMTITKVQPDEELKFPFEVTEKYKRVD